MLVMKSLVDRTRDALQVSKALAESCFGNFLSYFGLWVGVLILELEKKRGVSVGSSTLVLLSFTTNTLNLFRESDQGVLFASYFIQNPPLSEAPLFWKGNPLIPANLLLVLSTALLSTILCPGGGGSLSQMATYLICN